MLIVRKIFSTDDNDKVSGLVGAGLVGGSIGSRKLLKKSLIKDSKDIIPEDNKKVYEKLKSIAKERGIKDIKEVKSGSFYDLEKDTININRKKLAASLSHEMGHRHYDKEKAKTLGDKIGKLAHKLYRLDNKGILAVSVLNGLHSGINKANKESKGEKESKFNKHKSWVVPLALSTPLLVSEALATKHGLKLLKKSGASKELMKSSKKRLGKALGTYGLGAALSIGSGELTKFGTDKLIKKINKKDKANK